MSNHMSNLVEIIKSLKDVILFMHVHVQNRYVFLSVIKVEQLNGFVIQLFFISLELVDYAIYQNWVKLRLKFFNVLDSPFVHDFEFFN